jgi:amino acid permease
MKKTEFDFRLGIDQDKIVYKKDSFDWRNKVYFLIAVLVCWTFTAAWFALFQYANMNHYSTAFWIYIGVWLAFAIHLIIIITRNLGVHHMKKAEKIRKRKQEEEKRRQEMEKDKLSRMQKMNQSHSQGERLVNNNYVS